MNASLEALKERGFFAQCTNTNELSDRLDAGAVTLYVGCDPTGPSLHVGHIVPFFALRHLREAGHTGIALIGGGTGRIGDPSGKTEMRKVLSYETIEENVKRISAQLDRFVGFDGKSAFAVNNSDWLANLNYIDFLRDIGSCFSVNRMLTFEAYRQRMATGLSFLEFNYQLLQAFDFLMLHDKYGCTLQIGGDDQWGNITAGVDLIRRKRGNAPEHDCFGLTFPLITRSDGKKMGKSEKGAIFLDESMTSVFDFFQYWRNVDDADVRKFLLLFTFLPISEIDKVMTGNVNEAKERLAYEVTSIVHSREKADGALSAARAAFGGKSSDGGKSNMPTAEVTREQITAGINVVDLFAIARPGTTKSDNRRLVEQGGAQVSGRQVKDIHAVITIADADDDGDIVLRAGKKGVVRVAVK